MIPLFEYTVLAVVALFLIINPLSTVPVFLSITPGESPAARARTARMACMVATGVLVAFAAAGELIFRLMGITLPAFQIAGGVLLFSIAYEMMRSPQADVRLTPEEREIATDKEDVGIIPLGVPLLCGPGAISTTVLLKSEAPGVPRSIALGAAIIVVYLASFFILKISAHGAGWLNPIFLRVLRRIMGLLISAVAVQFILNGLERLGVLRL